MGYLSEVKISTSKKGYEYLKKYCDNHPVNYPLLGKNIKPEFEDIKGDSVVFGWSLIKWYNSFPEIHQIDVALETLDQEEIPWEFLRIGEEYDDVERRHSQFYLPERGLTTKIYIDDPAKSIQPDNNKLWSEIVVLLLKALRNQNNIILEKDKSLAEEISSLDPLINEAINLTKIIENEKGNDQYWPKVVDSLLSTLKSQNKLLD